MNLPVCVGCSYLNKVMEVALPTYVPSVEDVLKTRVRTSGIIEESYDIDGVSWRGYDSILAN